MSAPMRAPVNVRLTTPRGWSDEHRPGAFPHKLACHTSENQARDEMMSLARDRDQIGRDQRGRSHQLRAGIPGAANAFNPNRLAFTDLGGQVEEGVFDSLTLYESRTLVAFFNYRRRQTRVNEDYRTAGVSQVCGEVSGLPAGVPEVGSDHDSPRQAR